MPTGSSVEQLVIESVPFQAVSFRGMMKLRQRSHKSPVGVKFKFSDEYSLLFYMGAPPDFQMSNGK